MLLYAVASPLRVHGDSFRDMYKDQRLKTLGWLFPRGRPSSSLTKRKIFAHFSEPFNLYLISRGFLVQFNCFGANRCHP
jgi:hypothetical protein